MPITDPILDRLHEEGEEAYYAADYSTALEKWQAGLKQAREIDDNDYIGHFLGNIGLVYDNLRQYQDALEYYQQALIVNSEINAQQKIWRNINNIGGIYYSLGGCRT